MGSHYQLVVQEQNASYKHIGEYDYEYPSCKTTDDLKDVVLERITSGESLPEDLKSWGEHADDIQIQVYKYPKSLGNRWTEEISGTLKTSHLLGDGVDLDVDQQALIVVLVPLHFRFIVFQQGPTSYEYLTYGWVTGFPAQVVEVIEQAARDSVKQRTRSSVAVEVEVYEVLNIGDEISANYVKELITDEYLGTCYKLEPASRLEAIQNKECLLVRIIRRFINFALYENESSSCTRIHSGDVTVSLKDTVEVIEQVARGFITDYLTMQLDPAVETELIGVKVHEPKDSHEEMYGEVLEQLEKLDLSGELEGCGGLTTLLPPKTPISDIKSANLIVEFSVARYHKLSFKYWLFEVKPQLYARLYEFNTFGSVEATSKHTVGFIQDVVSKDIGNSRGWKIEVRVYEPWEKLREAHTLKLTDETLKAAARKLPSSHKLSDVGMEQTLIVTFCKERPPVVHVRELLAEMVRGQFSEAEKCSTSNLEAIRDGRGASGPPIQIYHPAFTTFIRESLDTVTKLTPEVLEMAMELISVSLEIYSTRLQRKAELARLKFWKSMSILSTDYTLGESTIRPDGSTCVDARGGLRIPTLIVEVNNEIGPGGSDPITRAEYFHARIFSSAEYDSVRKASCCPAILVGIAGPHLVVTGAIIGDGLTPQRLTDYVYLGHHPSREGRTGLDEGIRRVARILRALQTSAKLLKDYYLALGDEMDLYSPDAPVPPHFQEFTVNETVYRLKYKERLAKDQEEKGVFVAAMEPGGFDVVVKFAHSYRKDAHVLLASKSFAPRLRYCEKEESVGMYVVVMDLVVGEQFSKQPAGELQKAIQTLHSAGFVHGDLRGPNILVTKDGKLNIINFDWCGKDGEARYPYSINLRGDVDWDPDVTRGGLIKKDHDRTMFSRLTGLRWDDGAEPGRVDTN